MDLLFVFFFFQVLSLDDHSNNFVISPASIKLLLGILLEGADGNTAKEIRMALRLPNGKIESRKEFETWMSALKVIYLFIYLKTFI